MCCHSAATVQPTCSQLLNVSQCSLKLERWGQAAAYADKVLELDPSSTKALYRRGLARLELEELDEAKADLLRAVKAQPNSREIREAYERVKSMQAEAKTAEKAAFSGIFKPRQ